nr:unnamed protein product [Spirometra erinaceieuropaei]
MSLLSGSKGSFELPTDAFVAFDMVKTALADATLLTPSSPIVPISLMVDSAILQSARSFGNTLQQEYEDSHATIHDLLIADDCALNTTTEVDMQRSMDLLVVGFANFGLTINADKTVVMHQPSANTQHCAPP